MGKLYETLGASASKDGLHRALSEAGLEEEPGYFCKLVDDIAGEPAYYSFLHCDGAGTKSIVAYLLYRETGSVEHFAGLAQDALVMNLDDVYCVGVPQSIILSNIINRNKDRFPDSALSTLIRSYATLCAEYLQLGIPIQMGGGETADCGDIVQTVAIDAIVAGRIPRKAAIDTRGILPGDAIVGLSSTGQAHYETAPNSGIGSNGLTLARHALLSAAQGAKYPEVGGGKEDGWKGPYKVTDFVTALSSTVGAALLSPTRTYAPILAAIFRELETRVHGCIHCSGGGQTKALRFGKNLRYVKDDLFPIPPLFELIQHCGDVSWQEMYQVFNMGHRMELFVPESAVERVCEISRSFGVEAKRVGYVEQSNGENEVRILSPYGEFSYQLTSL